MGILEELESDVLTDSVTKDTDSLSSVLSILEIGSILRLALLCSEAAFFPPQCMREREAHAFSRHFLLVSWPDVRSSRTCHQPGEWCLWTSQAQT